VILKNPDEKGSIQRPLTTENRKNGMKSGSMILGLKGVKENITLISAEINPVVDGPGPNEKKAERGESEESFIWEKGEKIFRGHWKDLFS